MLVLTERVFQASRPGDAGFCSAAVPRGTLGADPVDRGDDGETGEHAARADRQQSAVRATRPANGTHGETWSKSGETARKEEGRTEGGMRVKEGVGVD